MGTKLFRDNPYHFPCVDWIDEIAHIAMPSKLQYPRERWWNDRLGKLLSELSESGVTSISIPEYAYGVDGTRTLPEFHERWFRPIGIRELPIRWLAQAPLPGHTNRRPDFSVPIPGSLPVIVESKINNNINQKPGQAWADVQDSIQNGLVSEIIVLTTWGNSDDAMHLLNAGRSAKMFLWEDILEWINVRDERIPRYSETEVRILTPVRDEVRNLLKRVRSEMNAHIDRRDREGKFHCKCLAERKDVEKLSYYYKWLDCEYKMRHVDQLRERVSTH